LQAALTKADSENQALKARAKKLETSVKKCEADQQHKLQQAAAGSRVAAAQLQVDLSTAQAAVKQANEQLKKVQGQLSTAQQQQQQQQTLVSSLQQQLKEQEQKTKQAEEGQQKLGKEKQQLMTEKEQLTKASAAAAAATRRTASCHRSQWCLHFVQPTDAGCSMPLYPTFVPATQARISSCYQDTYPLQSPCLFAITKSP
jgi:chromosome segregation ATPase